MKIQKLVFAAVLVVATSTSMFAQDKNEDSHTLSIEIPKVALLDIESATKSNDISLNAIAPTEAGDKVSFEKAVNNDLWLNYSSIVGDKSSRSVTVQITDGEVPSGINLTVDAKQYSGEGEGTMGEVTEKSINLSEKATTIINGIGSAYTGNGAKQGHNLTYQMTQQEGAYAKLNYDDSTTLTITYTLTDN